MDEKNTANIVLGVIGLIMGYVSFILTKVTNIPELNIIILIVILFLAKTFLERAVKIKQTRGWWLSNGVVLCIFLWLIVWTIFYNLA